jgi:hypothetical protein
MTPFKLKITDKESAEISKNSINQRAILLFFNDLISVAFIIFCFNF